MAFKLTKAQAKQRDEHVSALELANSDLTKAVDAANEKVHEINAALSKAIEAYNDKLLVVGDWREELTSKAQDEHDNKSEQWQEGDNGVSAADWIEAWKEIDFDPLENITIDEIEAIELEHRDKLEEAPDDMNS